MENRNMVLAVLVVLVVLVAIGVGLYANELSKAHQAEAKAAHQAELQEAEEHRLANTDQIHYWCGSLAYRLGGLKAPDPYEHATQEELDKVLSGPAPDMSTVEGDRYMCASVHSNFNYWDGKVKRLLANPRGY